MPPISSGTPCSTPVLSSQVQASGRGFSIPSQSERELIASALDARRSSASSMIGLFLAWQVCGRNTAGVPNDLEFERQ